MTGEIKQGIYFNMPEDEYHALPCLSRSMMDDILNDTEEAWYKSSFNPDRPEHKETEAMKLGTAIHSAILEPKVFDNLYCKPPSIQDFEGKVILKTIDDLKAFLDKYGEKKTGKKEDLIVRVLQHANPEKVVIWDMVKQEFEASIKEDGKRVLSSDNSEVIEGIRKSTNRRPKIKDMFTKGYPEVTIIWKNKETGVMCKCRLDYVRPDKIVELKSFSLKKKKTIYKACCDELVYQHYNLQSVVYFYAVQTIIKRINLGEAEVYGEVDKEWLKEFLSSPQKEFCIVFAKTSPPFQMVAIGMERNGGGQDNVYWSESESSFRGAVKKFKLMREIFGDERWIDEKYIRELSNGDVTGIPYQYL